MKRVWKNTNIIIKLLTVIDQSYYLNNQHDKALNTHFHNSINLLSLHLSLFLTASISKLLNEMKNSLFLKATLFSYYSTSCFKRVKCKPNTTATTTTKLLLLLKSFIYIFSLWSMNFFLFLFIYVVLLFSLPF